jgi:hypothetical protein
MGKKSYTLCTARRYFFFEFEPREKRKKNVDVYYC